VRPLPEKEREPGNDCPFGDVEDPKIPFEFTSMDITGPYPTTPRGNKYLLTFIDHLKTYVEAFPIPDHTAEMCASVYPNQIVTRHGSGSTLITDQGREFVIFKRTCKILGVRRVRTSSYHVSSNGMVERLHRSLHSGLTYYVNANHKKLGRIRVFLPHVIEPPLTQPRVTVYFTCCMGGRWFCPVLTI